LEEIYAQCFISGGGKIAIGENVGISNSSLCCGNRSITIGNDVLIGGSCKLYATDFHQLSILDRKENNIANIKSGDIVISEGAFIGASCIILKGVHIGKNAVIGAGSVVTNNVPDNELWAGNPARFVKKLV
jgi:acetyltransferase-like isoleucine patch superfamily enzyme